MIVNKLLQIHENELLCSFLLLFLKGLSFYFSESTIFYFKIASHFFMVPEKFCSIVLMLCIVLQNIVKVAELD